MKLCAQFVMSSVPSRDELAAVLVRLGSAAPMDRPCKFFGWLSDGKVTWMIHSPNKPIQRAGDVQR